MQHRSTHTHTHTRSARAAVALRAAGRNCDVPAPPRRGDGQMQTVKVAGSTILCTPCHFATAPRPPRFAQVLSPHARIPRLDTRVSVCERASVCCMDMEEDNPFATRGAAHTDVRLLLRKEGERGYTGPLPPATPPVDDDAELTPGTSPTVEDESQDDEIDPHIATTPTAPVSLHQEMTRLVATIIKSFIGSGVLFLPQAFYNGGWLFSSVIMAFMAVLTGITIFRLIECRHVIPGSYSYVGFRAYGRWAKVAVDVCLVLSQAGFCCVYIAFIARNVLQLLNVNKCWVSSDYLWLLVFMQLLVFAPLSWIKRIQSLGWTSLAANTFIVLGLSGILLYSGIEWAHDASPMQVSAMNTADFPLFLGTAVYAFEGIGMIVPMYESLSKEGQRRFPTVMTTTLGGIAAVYIIIGMVPYLYFSGKAHVELQDAITLNLPREWWAYLIIAGYCVALIFS
ncbi:hypothetical protein EON62_04040, partial [archaeon]